MIAVKLCCLNIIEVGNTNPDSQRMRILINSIPYSDISKGESIYLCINQEVDLVELEWSRQLTVMKRFIPPQCIKTSTIAVTPFWMEFDANPHFVRVQLKMILLTKNKQNKPVEKEKHQVIQKDKFKGQPFQSINKNQEESESWIDMRASSMSMAYCLESERTLNDLQNQRQKILESLFNKIKSSN